MADYMIKAADSEVFSGDFRPKSRDYDTFLDMGRMKMTGVHVLDLWGILLEKGYGFDFRYFYDFGHIKPVFHEIIAGEVYDFLVKSDIGLLFGEKSPVWEGRSTSVVG